MATWTTYTSTVTVPVYASWKCEKCGEINFATGKIICKCQEVTSSWRTSKHREAEEKASERVHAEWAAEAYKIINDPNHSASAMFSNFFLENTNCTRCGKKPRWNKNAKFLSLVGLAFVVVIMSGIAIFETPTSFSAWLALIGSVGFLVWEFAREEVHKKTLVSLPKQYTPVIGSLNPELIAFASTFGKRIPTPDECIELAREHNNILVDVEGPTQSHFCRKCGTELMTDSDFCHKCGMAVRK